MLPLEICALVLMASVARAVPQPQRQMARVANSTTVASASQQSIATGLGQAQPDPTGTPLVFTFSDTPMIIVEEPATGFVDGISITTPLTPQIFVTITPTVISIHTEIVQIVSTSFPGNEIPVSSQTASGGELLNEIISKIASPQPGAQPSSRPAIPTSSEPPMPNGIFESMPGSENTEQPVPTASILTETPGAYPTLAIGELITLGPATTLTLSNGLSTTVGSGSTATFVALTTDAAGYTIIIVSSSGTAVTATISNAPVTVTLPKTGWDASITTEQLPGTLSSATVSTTSSRGGASDSATWNTWVPILLGIVGSAVMG